MILIVVSDPSQVSTAPGFAQALGEPFDLLLWQGEPAGPTGAETVLNAGLDAPPTAEQSATLLAELAPDYSLIAAPSSMAAKDSLARCAGILRAPMVTDVTAILSPKRFERPVFAGSLVATVEVQAVEHGRPIIVTFRSASFQAPAPTALANSGSRHVEVPQPRRLARVSASKGTGGRPDLAQAKVVVSGGKPLKDSATFEALIGGLADALGGAAGATRAAVDSGIAPNELQVGQTGKVVAPNLYIAAGISGSTQHVAGIKDSKTIVAINQDPEAPIFDIADFGLVADLFVAVPELTTLLKNR